MSPLAFSSFTLNGVDAQKFLQGQVTVNVEKLDEFMSRLQSRMVVMQPLELLNQSSKFDAKVTVTGGGEAGQAGAIRLGIARALQAFNPEYRATLKKAGYLTRDQRMVERKKYGLHKARRGTQFSKR